VSVNYITIQTSMAIEV